MFYLCIANNKIVGTNTVSYQEKGVNYSITKIEVSENVYNTYSNDPDSYIWNGTEIVENPDYEEIKKRKHRQALDALTLTPADVERALYKAKGMDFEDLKTLIAQQLPTIDTKALAIEFRAKDFYRGAIANEIRLFDVVGQLLGYSSKDMDYLFTHKELPNGEN